MPLPEFRAKIRLEAAVSPSEDPARVAAALKNVVGEAEVESGVEGSSAWLATVDPRAFVRIRDQLRDRHVRSAARRQMVLNMRGKSTSLMLNRQAAAAGVVAICGSPEESPLGPIYMKVESGNLEAAIEWMAAMPDSRLPA